MGVICLDDINDTEYPGVASAMAEFCLSSCWCPFAIGFNKAYLCQREHLERYRSMLLNSGRFKAMASTGVLDVEVLQLHTRYAVPLEKLRERFQDGKRGPESKPEKGTGPILFGTGFAQGSHPAQVALRDGARRA